MMKDISFLFFLQLISIANTLPRTIREVTTHGTQLITLGDCGGKTTFVDSMVSPVRSKGVTMKKADYDYLGECSSFVKKCHKPSGTLTNQVVEFGENKLAIVFELFDLLEQDCWGYAVQITNKGRNEGESNKEEETHYFNFRGENKDEFYMELPVKMETTYNFTVVPLPTGKPESIITDTPTTCELPVLVDIAEHIIQEKIFKECEKVPEYEPRRKIAQSICEIKGDYDPLKDRFLDYATEKNCKLEVIYTTRSPAAVVVRQ